MTVDNKEKDNVLMKHNTLVSARYNLTPNECRAFTYMLYKIQMSNNTKGEKHCFISQEEFKHIIKNRNKTTTKGIIGLLKSLKKNDIYLKEKKINTENNYIWAEYSFISGFEFDDELNIFKITCADKVYDTLMNHDYKKDGFYTPINILSWMEFRLNSTQRLYELLRLWSNSKSIINYKISDLREVMMLENRYSEHKDFKKRVLCPAIKELNDSGSFLIEMKENKSNRKVVSIDFIVKDLDKREYFKDIILNKTKSDDLIVSNIQPCSITTNREIAITTNKEFYTPNKKLFTAKTLQMFQEDFSDYDFKDKHNQSKFYEATGITMAKDQENNIKVKSYNYFKTVLLDKLNEKEPNENPYKKTKFHNFDESFTQYSPEELDEIIEKSQREKYK